MRRRTVSRPAAPSYRMPRRGTPDWTDELRRDMTRRHPLGERALRKPEYWKTKDGQRIKIVEMKTSHILNCINYIRKKQMDEQPKFKQYVEVFEEELKRRNYTEPAPLMEL